MTRPQRPKEILEKAARQLAQGSTQTEVAKSLGVQRRTIRRWADDPDFLAAFEAETLKLQKRINAQIRRGAIRAVSTLSELMDSESERIRLQAAKAMLTSLGDAKINPGRESRSQNTNQTVIVLGTPEGNSAVAEAKARVMGARAAALPAGSSDHVVASEHQS